MAAAIQHQAPVFESGIVLDVDRRNGHGFTWAPWQQLYKRLYAPEKTFCIVPFDLNYFWGRFQGIAFRLGTHFLADGEDDIAPH